MLIVAINNISGYADCLESNYIFILIYVCRLFFGIFVSVYHCVIILKASCFILLFLASKGNIAAKD